MIRFAWLQARTQTLVALAGLIVVAVVAAVTGPHLVHLYDTTVATCAAHDDCATADSTFLTHDPGLRALLGVLVVVIPAVIGLFWGAPLVARELETGTYRLAWTQGVTRDRWLMVKLGVMGAASVAVAGLLSLIVTWWASPLDRVNMNIYSTFDERDIVPIGYAAFAFVLAVAAGVLIRRTLPAMATTLVAFVASRLLFVHFIRPHLMAPAHQSFAIDPSNTGFGSVNGGPFTLIPAPPDIPNAWLYSTRIVDKAGHGLPAQLVAKTCPTLGQSGPAPSGGGGGINIGTHHATVGPAPASAQDALQSCATKIAATYHEVVTYQPGSRYWTLQWYELAIFLVATVILAGVCFWAVRRRPS